MSDTIRPRPNSWLPAARTVADLVVLGLVVWLTRFWRSPEFGFYEDDYTLVTTGMAASWEEVTDFEWQLFSGFGGQGRPLQHGLVFFLSFVSGRLGGLQAAYVVAFVCVLAVVALFYALARRLNAAGWALLCSLSFAAFPADTTEAFLFHAFGLYQSLFWLLLAFHAHLSGRRWLAQILALGALLSYETAYPVFLVAPLLRPAGDRRQTARQVLGHGLLMAGFFAVVAMLRVVSGEERVSDLYLRQVITVPLSHMVQGPLVALGTYAVRPWQALQGWSNAGLVPLLALSVLAAGTLLARLTPPHLDETPGRSGPPLKERLKGLVWSERAVVWLLAVGLIALILAYPLTFTVRATALSGRATRVHLSAVVGASMVFGSVVYLALRLWRSRGAARAGCVAIAVYLALLVGFGQVVQADYARSWRLQREFWRQLLPLTPDLEDGVVVLVDPAGLQDTLQIDANTWNLQRILGQIYEFPETWLDPPRVYRLAADWRDDLADGEGRLAVSRAASGAPFHQIVASNRVILIDTAGGELARRAGPLLLGGTSYQLRAPAEPGPTPLPHGALFQTLVGGSASGSGGT